MTPRDQSPWYPGDRRPAGVRRPVAAVCAALAAGALGCGGERPTNPTSAKATSASSPCVHADGATCLGRLGAGTHHTKVFSPALTYRAPGGWGNYEDTPGSFVLVPPDATPGGVSAADFIGVYSAVAPLSAPCALQTQARVGATPRAMARTLRARHDLRVTVPRRVSIGGLKGLVLDLRMAEDHRRPCPFAAGTPFSGLIVGSAPGTLHHGLRPRLAIRLYLLRRGSHTTAIEIDDITGGHHLAQYTPVVKSFSFAR